MCEVEESADGDTTGQHPAASLSSVFCKLPTTRALESVIPDKKHHQQKVTSYTVVSIAR